MSRKDMIQEKFDELRHQAEVLMMEKGFVSPSAVDHDPLELIHELQTYQVELELQNEELQRSQQELLEFKTRYTELYDFTAALRAAGIVKLLLSFSQIDDEEQIPRDGIGVIKDALVLLRPSIPTTHRWPWKH